MLALRNEHARVTVLSAVWSEADRQLVGAVVACPERMALKALQAELEKNSANAEVILSGDAHVTLAGARRGYLKVAADLERIHATGVVAAWLHRRAHDPRAAGVEEGEPFYVVTRRGEPLLDRFAERLQLALCWPIALEWAKALLGLGQEAGLVEPLAVASAAELPTESTSFEAGLRVVKSDGAWAGLIADALASGAFRL